ncbi:restriction endonuclease subunit S [Clostridium perfringens]|nr:restriction endonuclease subunit S [Clostridium perfringens]
MLKNVKLKELGEIFTGSTPSKKNKEFYNSEDIMFIKPDILDFDIVNIGVSNEYISEKAREKARIIPANSLLVSCIGSIGKLGINEKEVAFNQQINAIVPNNKIKSSRYLAYLLKYNQKKLESIANAPVVPIINKTQFSEFEVLIHENLNFQEQITQILDKSKEIIEKRKEQIQFLDKLVKSKFIEMFGDPITNSKEWNTFELREGIKEIKYGTSKPPIFSEEGIPFVRATNIKFGRIIENDMKYISEYEAEKIEKCKLSLGDTIIVRSGANTGDNAFVSEEYVGSYGGYDIIVKLNEKINYIFLNALLNSIYRETIIQPLTRRAGQPHLNSEQIQSLVIYNPPIELQNQFADFVKQVDKLKFEMEKSLKELEDNFNSLMQNAFKGELFK